MKLSWKPLWSAALVLGLIFCLLLVWGVLIEPKLIEVKEETAVVPGLPNEWQGKRLALIADLQVGMWFGNEETVRRIVRRIIAEKPAAVLIAGDFVYHPMDEDEPGEVEKEEAGDFAEEVDAAAALVKPLTEAAIPVYAVLGNHDYGMGYPDSIKNRRLADAVRQKLEAAGVAVLANTARPLRPPEAAGAESSPSLYLVGIDSRYAGNDQPETALAGVPSGAPRIVLMHNPGSFAALPAQTAPLAFAGHTHGGQIRIPFTKDWSWMALLSSETVHADGWIDGYGQAGNRLYVNRGIGFSSFPVRINCRPELTFFTLHSANQ